MKSNKKTIVGSTLLAGILVFGIYGIGSSIASGGFGHDEDDDESNSMSYGISQKVNTLYSEECGSCHMAYPAALLPAKSWSKMMSNLEDHFGENAELDKQTQAELETYLLSSVKNNSIKSRKLFRNLGDKSPLRITQLPYFKHEHEEIPKRFITGNDKVKSLSQCNACHSKAEKGNFNEDDVFIPNVGRWDD